MSKSAILPNLDILRAVAVLLVVIDHSAKFFGAPIPPRYLDGMGAAGVYLFFVHTCLVLMLSLERQQIECCERMTARFYARRFFRIYPLSMAFVLTVAAFAIPSASIAGPFQVEARHAGPGEVASNLALAMNLTGHVPILGQLWSLPPEVQMYVVLPAAYLLSRRFGFRGVSAAWCGSVIVAVSVAAMPFPGSWRLSALQFAPCFIPGVLAYALWRRRPRFRSRYWLPTLSVLCASYCLIGGQIASWFLCLAVGLLVPQFAQLSPESWFAVCAHQVAKYSYGIYLGHVMALWIGFRILSGPGAVACWLVALCMIPVAAYRCIEEPGIRIGGKVAKMLVPVGKAG